MTIDLRSDTVTQPSPAMRRAMAEAPVGDDVFGEDPTINDLERRAAALMGKEAALFVASGTMGNITAILTHAGRGDEVIVGSESHILLAEVGGAGALAGTVLRPLPNDARGRLDADQVAATIRPQNVHFPNTALVCIENTHNRCGGAALGPEEIAPVAAVARGRGAALHIDGARIFNAAVARGIPAADLVAQADSVTFCLSKGLACPVGSLLCGSADFIERARRNRKMLGGGMRQAGILAAAGLVALDTMIDRLAEDHANAKALARGLAEMPGIEIDPDAVETNILFLRTTDEPAPELARRMTEAGVLANAGGPSTIRMVTHYGVERGDIDQALDRISGVVRQAVAV